MRTHSALQKFRIISTAVALAFPAGSINTSAEAGQPWSCSCNGKPKRFIASTNACEWSQQKNRHLMNRPGGRKLLVPCTPSEFTAWNRRACAQDGCSLRR